MQENGVDTAIQCIYRDMEYAKSLIEKKAMKNAAAADRATTSGSEDIDDDAEEESWTFVGDGDDEDIDVDAALKQSSLFISSGGEHGVKVLGTRATIPSTGVLWTNAGTTMPLGLRTPPANLSPSHHSNSSGTGGSFGDSSPRDTRDNAAQAHAEKQGR